MEQFIHLTAPEMGHGLIALAVLAAALPLFLSAAILLVLVTRMVRARCRQIWPRRAAQRTGRVDARLQNLASQRTT